MALIQRLTALNNPAFFAHLRVLLDHFQADELDVELAEVDKMAIAEGRADVAAGSVESWEEFRKGFVRFAI